MLELRLLGIRVSTSRLSIGFVAWWVLLLASSSAQPVAADPGYLALWREDSAWVRYHDDVPHSGLRDLIASEEAQGFRVASFDVRDFGINVRRYALVFQPGSGKEYWVTDSATRPRMEVWDRYLRRRLPPSRGGR